jgi:hypothetical protein
MIKLLAMATSGISSALHARTPAAVGAAGGVWKK